MAGWLIGISIAGFFVSLLLSAGLRPAGLARLGRGAVARWWAGSLAIAVGGIGLTLLFAWPAWHLGQLVGPWYEVSKTTGGALFACIFGLGGAGVTGAGSVILSERFEKTAKSGEGKEGSRRR